MKFVILFFAAFFTSSWSELKWDGLRVTWNRDVTNPNYFVRYPRTEEEAIKEGFTKIEDCNLTGKWRGKRYIKDNSLAVIVLYDTNGYIAGIQTSITKTPTYPPSTLKPPFIDDGDRTYLTAYFTDPSKICTTGRSAEEFAAQGTGTHIYLQNGTSPESSIRAPSNLDEIKSTLWTKGKCIPVMGIHYYYNLSYDMSCDDLFPAVLLYNGGRLNVLAWIFLATIPDKHYEVSPQKVYPFFVEPVPKCFSQYKYLTTQHVFLTDDVTLNKC